MMTLQKIPADSHALEEDILAFERKYGVFSEAFYSTYISSEETENDRWVLDFGEGAGIYHTWLPRQAGY